MPISEAKKRNNANYTAKCDYINLRPLKPEGRGLEPRQRALDKACRGIFCKPSGIAWPAMISTPHRQAATKKENIFTGY